MSIVYVCPGPADTGEGCGIWMSAPGHCWVHPHITLMPHDASALTGPSAVSYADLHGCGICGEPLTAGLCSDPVCERSVPDRAAALSQEADWAKLHAEWTLLREQALREVGALLDEAAENGEDPEKTIDRLTKMVLAAQAPRNLETTGGPFVIGDEVVVCDGDNRIDDGVIDGERDVNGEWFYDVRGKHHRHYGVSESDLLREDGLA